MAFDRSKYPRTELAERNVWDGNRVIQIEGHPIVKRRLLNKQMLKSLGLKDTK